VTPPTGKSFPAERTGCASSRHRPDTSAHTGR
jgi:hypothetical protein